MLFVTEMLILIPNNADIRDLQFIYSYICSDRPASTSRDVGLVLLPRKEVIHPQLPLRIPCYDLTPIISPTLGLGKLGRQVLATFMV